MAASCEPRRRSRSRRRQRRIRDCFLVEANGRKKFGAWTGANINEYMGVVLNDEVKSIAFIKSQITDSGQIEGKIHETVGRRSGADAKVGALPASIEYSRSAPLDRASEPTRFVPACALRWSGWHSVVLFMLIYYRGSGINAVVALLLNMVLMLAGLMIFGATLTFPGIAGIILTIGMAVDSNVLIFERIREEMQSGKTIPSASIRALRVLLLRSSIRTSRRSFRQCFCLSSAPARFAALP